jgi:vanillate O-demethylase ferredoxin subunit
MSEPLREMRLTAIRYAGHLVNTYEFAPLDGAPVRHRGPGTHIDLEVQEGCLRQYSLVELRDDAYVVAVQRERASRGGSTHLHDTARVGDRFRVGDPRNLFGLEETAAHSVLIAGGIGIAPMLPMIARLDALGASWELHYAWRTGEVPFERDLRCHAGKVTLAIRDAPGYRRLEIQRLVAEARTGSTFYCCGPEAMLESFQRATAALPEDRVHVEHFAAAGPVATNGGYIVVLARSGQEIAVAPGQTILEALLDHGVDAPHSCQQGICGACETGVVSGVPDHRDGILSSSERAANKTMMICCSGSAGPRLVLDR